MAALDDVLKAGPLGLIGLGVFGIALPLLVPSLRPPFAAALKAGAKLFLEAELDADNALADRLVDAAVDSLLMVSEQPPGPERARKTDQAVDHFVTRARRSAHRRGFDEQDARRRYHRRLTKLDHALTRVHRDAQPSQRRVLEHASNLVKQHNEAAKRTPVPAQLHAPAMLSTTAIPVQTPAGVDAPEKGRIH